MLIQLTDSDRLLLRQLQKTESAKRDYVKITTILLLDQEYSVDTIEQILGIDHTTVYRYAQTYRTETISGLLGDAYAGWWGRLDSQQLCRLQTELKRGFYISSEAIADWIQTQFTIT